MSQFVNCHYTYAVLGTGALGGYYGACLQKAGLEVHFLLHQDYEQVSQFGLKIESPDGDFVLPTVHAYSQANQMPPCDVVIIALKTTHNHLLPQLLPAVVKPQGVVLVLQNGLGIEPEVAEIVPDAHVLGGLCFLCSNKVGPGHIRHLDYKKISLGEYAAGYQTVGISDRMRQIAQDFELAGIPIQLSEDLLTARWRKLVWNIPFNGLSVILDATTDQLMSYEQTRTLSEQLMLEVVKGATACDRTIPLEFVTEMLEHTQEMTPYRTSMKIDYDSARPLEVEAIFGNPLRAAQAAGAELPQIQTLYQQLKFLDTRNRQVGCFTPKYEQS